MGFLFERQGKYHTSGRSERARYYSCSRVMFYYINNEITRGSSREIRHSVPVCSDIWIF